MLIKDPDCYPFAVFSESTPSMPASIGSTTLKTPLSTRTMDPYLAPFSRNIFQDSVTGLFPVNFGNTFPNGRSLSMLMIRPGGKLMITCERE